LRGVAILVRRAYAAAVKRQHNGTTPGREGRQHPQDRSPATAVGETTLAPAWPAAPAMIIDDDEHWVSLLTTALRHLGWDDVRSLTDATRTVDLVREFKPAVVLLDLRLADRSGLDVLGELREMERPPPVIVVTCVDQIEVAVTCMRQGASDFLTKPLKRTNLVRALLRALGAGDTPDDEPPPPTAESIHQLERLPNLKEVKDMLIEEALQRSKGVLKDAAAMLGVTPQAICNRRRRHRLDVEED
jgi:DNA-binding NtrC family response regulator